MYIDRLVSDFLEIVPELKEGYENRKNCDLISDNDGYYIHWGIGLMPEILELFRDFESNQAVLDRVFKFFEKMANSDEEIKELLIYGILENLGDQKEILEQSWPLMGATTFNLSKSVECFLGRNG